MGLGDIIYFAAYGIFLTGAFLFFRSSRKTTAHRMMTAGVLVDFFATVMPHSGFKSVAINVGSSATIISAMGLAAMVWLLFLASLFIRATQKNHYYYRMILSIIVLWFLNLVLFLHGVYRQY